MYSEDNPKDHFQDAKILVADDGPDVLEEIQKWLNLFNYQNIRTATSAAECVQILESGEEHFDVIIADMFMENEDSGFFVLEKVQQANITSAVIILTANDTTEDSRRAFRSGAWDYISKNWRGNVFEMMHESIQDALRYYSHWMHRDNEAWIREHKEELRVQYSGQFIAVLNQSILESTPTRGEIERVLDERKLPRFLTAIEYMEPVFPSFAAELTVLVEGPTDVKYLKAAADCLNENPLMERIQVDTIGNEDGGKGNGFKALKQGFDFLMHNPKLYANAILFLFDQDVRHNQLPNKGEDHETLYVRLIDEYSENDKGIEYLLSEQILIDGFQKEFIEKDLGRATARDPNPQSYYVIKEKNKMDLCKWICNERQNDASDFAQFQHLFDLFRTLLPDTSKHNNILDD